jgi:hypothetical protein
MAYLGILAYPESDEKRDRFITAYKALVIKEAIRRGYDRKLYRPHFRKLANQQINGTLRRGEARILSRLRAATMARLIFMADFGLPLISQALCVATGKKMDGRLTVNGFDLGPSPSINTIATWLAGEVNAARGIKAGGATREHVKDRIWRASKPVLHLAMALQARWKECQERGRAEFWDLFQQPDWVAASLVDAERLRRALCGAEAFPRLAVLDEMTIQVLPKTVEKLVPRQPSAKRINKDLRRSSTG